MIQRRTGHCYVQTKSGGSSSIREIRTHLAEVGSFARRRRHALFHPINNIYRCLQPEWALRSQRNKQSRAYVMRRRET